jgi:hypothetical protein
MLLEFAILHALFEVSVVLAAILGNRADREGDETLDLEEL